MDTLSNTTPQIRRRKVTPAGSSVEVRRVGGYRLLRRLAAGGMSTVYLGYDDAARSLIAIKILAPELAANKTCIDRFQLEGNLGHDLKHPNIVYCHEHGVDEQTGQHFLIMEYVAGRSAQQVLDEDGPLPLGMTARIAFDIARGLQEIHHRRYVHRDVKPGNILIDEDGRAKLADLGVAKNLINDTELTSQDTGVGTPFYMPFEQMMNSSIVDERTDLFALGVTMYQLLTGRVPFPGRSFEEVYRAKEDGEFLPAREWIPELPPIVDVILARLLDRNPSQRYRDAGHFIEILLASGMLDTVGPSATVDEVDDLSMPTRRDMSRSTVPPRPAKHTAPLWTVQYKGRDGKTKRLDARVATIERLYEEGKIPSNFLVVRGNTLIPFRTLPDFQHLAEHPAVDWLTPPPSDTPVVIPPTDFSPVWRGALVVLISVMITAMASTVYHKFLLSHIAQG